MNQWTNFQLDNSSVCNYKVHDQWHIILKSVGLLSIFRWYWVVELNVLLKSGSKTLALHLYVPLWVMFNGWKVRDRVASLWLVCCSLIVTPFSSLKDTPSGPVHSSTRYWISWEAILGVKLALHVRVYGSLYMALPELGILSTGSAEKEKKVDVLKVNIIHCDTRIHLS